MINRKIYVLLKVGHLELYISVFRQQRPGVKEEKVKKMAEAYMGGPTMRSYESSYRRLVELCRKCELSVFGLDEGVRCLLWRCTWEAERSPP